MDNTKPRMTNDDDDDDAGDDDDDDAGDDDDGDDDYDDLHTLLLLMAVNQQNHLRILTFSKTASLEMFLSVSTSSFKKVISLQDRPTHKRLGRCVPVDECPVTSLS